MTSGELGKAMSFETPLFDISDGIGGNIQWKVEAPFQFTRDGVYKANAGLLGKINAHLLWFGAVGESYAASDAGDTTHTRLMAGLRLLAGGP